MIRRKKGNMILNFDFDLPCRTSPRRCSQGSPGDWSWVSFLRNLYEQNYDDWYINGRDI